MANHIRNSIERMGASSDDPLERMTTMLLFRLREDVTECEFCFGNGFTAIRAHSKERRRVIFPADSVGGITNRVQWTETYNVHIRTFDGGCFVEHNGYKSFPKTHRLDMCDPEFYSKLCQVIRGFDVD